MKYLIIALLFSSIGTKAQTVDSLGKPLSSNKSTSLVSYIPPALYVGYGFMALNNKALIGVDRSVYNDMREDHPNFSTEIDDYLRYSPAAASIALNIAGIKGRHSFTDQTFIYLISAVIVSNSVTFLKRRTRQLRPDGNSYSAFPSGHTATAFAAAEFMHQEFGERSAWYSIGAYSAATATGVLRVYNNAHWFSNIIAGAGVGILSTKAAYLIYPHIKNLVKQRNNISVVPFYYNRASGLTLSASF